MSKKWLLVLVFVLSVFANISASDTLDIRSRLIYSESKSSLFKVGLTVSSRYFGGLMYVKSTDENKERIIFLSELGLKYFDFEFNKSTNSVEVKYAMSYLNKKALIALLKSDLQFLLNDYEIVKKRTKSNNVEIIKTTKSRFKRYVESGGKESIIERGFLCPKRILEIDGNSTTLKHKSIINIKFQLRKIK